MELPVTAQGRAFFLAVLCGLALSLGYDLLRGFRRLCPRLTWISDLIWSIAFFWSMLCFLLGPAEGLFRGYHGLGVFLGACLWFLTVSSYSFVPLLNLVEHMQAAYLQFEFYNSYKPYP